MNTDRLSATLASRAFLTVAGSTILLTAAFVGMAVVWEGLIVSGLTTRLPFYVLVFAVAFVVSLLQLDNRDRDGATVLIATVGIGVLAAILVGLAAEGAFYTAHEPAVVFRTQLVVVFFAAGIICTGLGIWGVRHWREFVDTRSVADVDPDLDATE